MLTVLAFVAPLVCGVICYRVGYAVGQIDRECGVSQPWPWSTVRRHSD